MSPADLMRAIDGQLAHVWMVRAFIKHSDEAAEDEELAEVHRELYDFMLAVGGPFKANNAEEYLKLAKKKLGKLKKATELFERIQPEVSQHTNFIMAAASLKRAVEEVGRLLGDVERDGEKGPHPGPLPEGEGGI
jgi:tRNA U34 5-carboxymethylaminomethyl modifying GTPase MnmE/TrmE